METIDLAGFRIELIERDSPKKYAGYPYSVKTVKKTPNGKYLKEKTITHFVYKSYEEASNAAIKKALEITNNENERKKEKEEKRQANLNVKAADYYKIGDILVNSWGYEQTNIEFYQVTEIKQKTIVVRQISQIIEAGSYYSHGMACNVLPVPNSFIIDGRMDKLTYQLRVKANGCLSQPQSYYYIHKWDGRPMYCSWYA